jgi:hypothetical protein
MMAGPPASLHVSERARRASWQRLADAVADEMGYGSPLHVVALDAARNKRFEPSFHAMLGECPPGDIERVWARLDAAEANGLRR